MVSEVSTGASFAADIPRALFDAPDITADVAYDVAPDGQFLLAVENPDSPAREIHVVENWFEDLRRLDPND